MCRSCESRRDPVGSELRVARVGARDRNSVRRARISKADPSSQKIQPIALNPQSEHYVAFTEACPGLAASAGWRLSGVSSHAGARSTAVNCFQTPQEGIHFCHKGSCQTPALQERRPRSSELFEAVSLQPSRSHLPSNRAAAPRRGASLAGAASAWLGGGSGPSEKGKGESDDQN